MFSKFRGEKKKTERKNDYISLKTSERNQNIS